MSRTAVYHTTVSWTGEHWGHLRLGNGPEMDFSAPPDAQGHPGVLTPEDAFVAAANTCVMMMFVWAAERFKLKLLSYDCRVEGTKLIELDRTETFTQLRFRPVIRIAAGGEDPKIVEARTRRALQSAQKYSLVANSVKSEILIEPTITVETAKENVRMITVKVLGSGCPNCKAVEAAAREAISGLGLQANIIKVQNHDDITHYKILSTPGLVINEKVVCAGRIPSVAEVTTWLADAAVQES